MLAATRTHALQLLRFILGWEVTLNGAIVPVWASGVAFVIVGGPTTSGLSAGVRRTRW